MKLVFVLLALVCIGYCADSDSTYKDIKHCQDVCGDMVCARATNSHLKHECESESSAFNLCFNAGDVPPVEDCKNWKNYLKNDVGRNINDEVDWDEIENYRSCAETCGDHCESDLGKQYATCMLDCHSNLIAFSLIMVALLAVLL